MISAGVRPAAVGDGDRSATAAEPGICAATGIGLAIQADEKTDASIA
jgi:hypothetical protein